MIISGLGESVNGVDHFEGMVLFRKFLKGGQVEERVFTYFLVHLSLKNNKLISTIRNLKTLCSCLKLLWAKRRS